nr:MAG TPA: hypothetical protein [Caudoviricetes sp.]
MILDKKESIECGTLWMDFILFFSYHHELFCEFFIIVVHY